MEISSIASLAGFIAVRFLAAMIYATLWFGKKHITPAFAAIEHDICGRFSAHLATALVRIGLCHDLSDDELSNKLATHGAAPDFVLPGLYWE